MKLLTIALLTLLFLCVYVDVGKSKNPRYAWTCSKGAQIEGMEATCLGNRRGERTICQATLRKEGDTIIFSAFQRVYDEVECTAFVENISKGKNKCNLVVNCEP